MNGWFWICAALMLAAALLLILRPLLARTMSHADTERKRAALDAARKAGILDEAEYQAKLEALASTMPDAPGIGRAQPAAALALAALVPLLATGVYLISGTPAALRDGDRAQPAADGAATAADMEQAIARLAARLESEPNDLQGWLLLGRAYKSLGRFDEARRALERARTLAPDDNDAAVEYAEAVSLARADRLIEGEARRLLEQALARDPQHQRALWLLGIADAQAGDYAAAVAHWERLLPLLEAGSPVANSVATQIDEARVRAGLPPRPREPTPLASAAAGTAPAADAAQTTAADTTAPATGVRLSVVVDVSPALRERVAPTDTLYVFARAPDGPRMPLALQRLTAATLPVTVVLDDSMGMLPQLKLSTASEVVVGARISKSGVANPQSGDLEGFSAALSPGTANGPIQLTIDRIVP